MPVKCDGFHNVLIVYTIHTHAFLINADIEYNTELERLLFHLFVMNYITQYIAHVCMCVFQIKFTWKKNLINDFVSFMSRILFW